KKKVSLYDSQAPICPICQVLLRPGELQEHMEQEMERLTHMHIRPARVLSEANKGVLNVTELNKNPSHKNINAAPGTPKSLLLSVHIKREGESPVVSPLSSDEAHHSDRYQVRRETSDRECLSQTFLRVRANRQTRLNAPAQAENLLNPWFFHVSTVDDLCWCRRYAKESFKSPPIPVPRGVPLAPCCLRHARIGKMKRRKPEDGQREGGTEEDSADVEGENGTRFEEYEWWTGFAMCSTKESHDSDADLDVDGDDTLEYGKAQYTEADIIPCSGEDQGEAKEQMPSTSNGESSKQEPSSSSSSSTPRTCKNSEIEKITEDSTATTLEALKARIRELEKQILRGDRYKCLICMRKPTQTGADGKNQAVERHGSAEALQLGVYCLYRGYVTGCSTATAGSSGIKKLLPLRRDSYTMPLTSIQCWHVHCEECWLRTLGNKKLCPQCNTITSPGDLRRVYL
ncbi:hypothetical protein cypCar_00025326, partial [Cyprinus carpio]